MNENLARYLGSDGNAMLAGPLHIETLTPIEVCPACAALGRPLPHHPLPPNR